MSSLLAKVAVLSYDSVAASKTSALKTYYRPVRLIKDAGYVNPTQPSYITNILLCGNCIDAEKRKLYVFYIDTFFRSAWIIEIDIDTRVQEVVYYDKYNDIGFDPAYKIYNPKVVHGRIVWTDNKNPIYQMDIERAKKSFALKIGYGQYPDTAEWSAVYPYGIDQIVSNGNNFYKNLIDNNVGVEPKFDDGSNWEKLCLIEDAYYSMNIENFLFEAVPPKLPPVVTYQSDDSRKINNLRQTLFQVAYRYVYMDWRKSTFSPASIVPMPQAEEETATGLASEQISLNNKLQIEVNSGGEEVRTIEIIGRSSADPSKWYLIETINKIGEQERNDELSKTVRAGYSIITITIPQPIVKGTNIVSSNKVQLGLWIVSSATFNTNVNADVTSMIWEGAMFGVSVAKTTMITTNGSGLPAFIDSKPDWITILNGINGGEVQIGWAIGEGESLLVFPTEINTGITRSGTLVLKNSVGDSAVISLTHSVNVIYPVAVECTIEKDPLDTSELVVTQVNVSAMSLNTHINFTVLVDYPAYFIYTPYTVYWRAIVTRNAITQPLGNGEFGVEDEVHNDILVNINTMLLPGDRVKVYISFVSVLESTRDKVSMVLNVFQPRLVINSFVSTDKDSMSWVALQYDEAVAETVVVACPPISCILISKPTWIAIHNGENFSITEGMQVYDGESLHIFPNAQNLGAPRSGMIVFTNIYGDTKTMVMAQAVAITPPEGVLIVCNLQAYSGDTSGLLLMDMVASTLSGSKNITWESLIDHYAHGTEAWTMYWRIKVNDNVQGSGTFETRIGSGSGEIVSDVTLWQGDNIVIEFSSVPF
jgi:hypothetical protein